MENATNENTNSESAATVNLSEGMASIKRALTFIGELMALNSRLAATLPPAEREKAKVLTPSVLPIPTPHTPSKNKQQGYGIAEFAEILGVHRGSLREHLVEVPPGPAPPLPAGKIPCRRIGKVRRIFKEDFFGTLEDRVQSNDTVKKTPTGADLKGNWRGQIDRLRFASNAGE